MLSFVFLEFLGTGQGCFKTFVTTGLFSFITMWVNVTCISEAIFLVHIRTHYYVYNMVNVLLQLVLEMAYSTKLMKK